MEQEALIRFLQVQQEELFDWKSAPEIKENLWNWYVTSLTDEARDCSTMTLIEQALLYERLTNLIEELEALMKMYIKTISL